MKAPSQYSMIDVLGVLPCTSDRPQFVPGARPGQTADEGKGQRWCPARFWELPLGDLCFAKHLSRCQPDLRRRSLQSDRSAALPRGWAACTRMTGEPINGSPLPPADQSNQSGRDDRIVRQGCEGHIPHSMLRAPRHATQGAVLSIREDSHRALGWAWAVLVVQ